MQQAPVIKRELNHCPVREIIGMFVELDEHGATGSVDMQLVPRLGLKPSGLNAPASADDAIFQVFSFHLASLSKSVAQSELDSSVPPDRSLDWPVIGHS